MKYRTTRFLFSAMLLLVASAAIASESSSTSYRMQGVFNSGGRPDDGGVATSAGYQLTLDSLGDGIAAVPIASASFMIDSGMAGMFPPPGEVVGLMFSDDQTLFWDPERSVGAYHLYRGALADLSGLAYGACAQPAVTQVTTTDGDTPASGAAFFYLVTAENRLGEQGTKGAGSASVERQWATCP